MADIFELPLIYDRSPPYINWDEMDRDAARQAERRSRKARGLPTSEHVGNLVDMMSTPFMQC